jgi:hypothetical protein
LDRAERTALFRLAIGVGPDLEPAFDLLIVELIKLDYRAARWYSSTLRDNRPRCDNCDYRTSELRLSLLKLHHIR